MTAPQTVNASAAKFRAYDVLGAAGEQGCGNGEGAEYMSHLLDRVAVKSPNVAPQEPDLFTLPALARYLYQFGNCFNDVQKSRLLEGIAAPQHLLDHGTVNHAVMRLTSWYLIAQYFHGATWHDFGGKTYTSAELMAAISSLLRRRTWAFYQHGYYELFSPTYTIVDLFPLLNLIDFANEKGVRDFADAEANLDVAAVYSGSFHGHLVAPLLRQIGHVPPRGAPNVSAWNIDTAQMLWLYTGEPALSPSDIENRQEPVYIAVLALSKWRPLVSAKEVAPLSGGDEGVSITPTFSIWDGPTTPAIFGNRYMTENYAIGVANQIFHPSGENGYNQGFGIVWQNQKLSKEITCYHPYWASNKGEDDWSDDLWSPFQQEYLKGAEGVLLFSIPDKDPWVQPKNNQYFLRRNIGLSKLLDVVKCRIPKSVEHVEQGSNWIFVKDGAVNLALNTLYGKNEFSEQTINSLKYIVVKIHQQKTGIYFYVDAKLNFSEFKTKAKSQSPKFTLDPVSATLNGSGKTTKVSFDISQNSDLSVVSSIPKVSINSVDQFPDLNTIFSGKGVVLHPGTLFVKNGATTDTISVGRKDQACGVLPECFSVIRERRQ